MTQGWWCLDSRFHSDWVIALASPPVVASPPPAASGPVNPLAMKSILRGSFFTVAMRWSDRLIGLVSTLVLARLLVPADFGVIAMASLVIALADVFFDLGVYVTLIQNRAPTQEHFNTAWTLGLLQSAVAAVVLFVAAPYAAVYFREPRVEDVIKVLGVSLLLSAFENIGVVTFQKEMRFGQDFVFMFSKRLSGFVVTVVAAWLLQSYWALVIGTVVGRLMGVACSYWMHPMRPRLSLARLGDIMGVSQWLLARTAGGYLESQLHRIVVGRRDDATVMGAYAMAGDISSMPSTELLMPINRVLFPAFVKVKDDLQELKRVFLLAQGVQILVAIPASAGLAMVAPEVITLMLGEKWLLAVPFMQIFAVAYLASAMLSSASYLMITLDHVKALALFSWVQVGMFAMAAIWIFPAARALEIAWLRLAVSVASDAVFIWLLLRLFPPLKLLDLARGAVRPLLGVVAMVVGLHLFGQSGAALAPWTALVAKTLVGALVYTLVVLGLWWAGGRPPGAETFILDNLRKALGQRRQPFRETP